MSSNCLWTAKTNTISSMQRTTTTTTAKKRVGQKVSQHMKKPPSKQAKKMNIPFLSCELEDRALLVALLHEQHLTPYISDIILSFFRPYLSFRCQCCFRIQRQFDMIFTCRFCLSGRFELL